MKISTLFIGTSEFAIPILKRLFELEYLNVTGIVTQPDKPAGRKQELKAPPIKQWALDNHKWFDTMNFQPEKLGKDSLQILDKVKPELIIVASYGQFVPKSMLDYPKYKCLNIHVSLLPDLRGAVPMPMAILNGYKETGVTLQVMGEGMDEGNIIATKSFAIGNQETTETLTTKASRYAVELIDKVLEKWVKDEISPTPQNNEKATYCYQKDISKEAAEIDWKLPATKIDQMVRAFYPWPIAWFELSEFNKINQSLCGKRVKVYSVKVYPLNIIENSNTKIGELFKHNKSLFVKCGDGFIELEDLQLEGKNRMNGKEYLYLIGSFSN